MDFLFHLSVNRTIDAPLKNHIILYFLKIHFFFFYGPQILIYIHINVRTVDVRTRNKNYVNMNKNTNSGSYMGKAIFIQEISFKSVHLDPTRIFGAEQG